MESSELWVLTDGRAGNVAQAAGLAEALARVTSYQPVRKDVELKQWAAIIPPQAAYLLGASRKGWPFKGLAKGAEGLVWPWPHAVIGAGRRVAPITAALRRLHGVAGIQVLDPKLTTTAFDAVVAPEHDGLTGANVFSTVGSMNRLTRETIAEAAQNWPVPREIGERPVAVLVGGGSSSCKFDEADGLNVTLALESMLAQHSLIVTTSRRTDPGLARQIAQRLGDRAVVWTGEDDGPNPYPALLHYAEAVLVTEDSVNMASEAATTGMPVHVFPVASVSAKIARFHEALAQRGASRRFRGEIQHWSYEPLAEADRIAADLLRRGII